VTYISTLSLVTSFSTLWSLALTYAACKLLSLLDIHIYKISITNEGASGILLTGVCKLLVLLDSNLVCLDSVTSFQFQIMCGSSTVTNILSLLSSSCSCVIGPPNHNPHDVYIYLWAGRHFIQKSALTGWSETSLISYVC